MDYTEDTNLRPESPIDETESDLCRALWIAVAVQTLIDATNKSKKKTAIKAKNQALQWLSETADDRSDFAMVCDLAGIDRGSLNKKFQQALRNPEVSLDFRCLKKAGISNRGNESRKRYFARIRRNKQLREMDRGKHLIAPTLGSANESKSCHSQGGNAEIRLTS